MIQIAASFLSVTRQCDLSHGQVQGPRHLSADLGSCDNSTLP